MLSLIATHVLLSQCIFSEYRQLHAGTVSVSMFFCTQYRVGMKERLGYCIHEEVLHTREYNVILPVLNVRTLDGNMKHTDSSSGCVQFSVFSVLRIYHPMKASQSIFSLYYNNVLCTKPSCNQSINQSIVCNQWQPADVCGLSSRCARGFLSPSINH